MNRPTHQRTLTSAGRARGGFSSRALAAATLALLVAPSARSAPPAGATPAGGPTQYARQSAAIFDGPKGKVMGSVPPGTPMEVVESTGPRAKVVLRAWSREYAPLDLVADPGSMTPRATMARVPDGLREVASEKVDAYEAKWQEVRWTTWIEKKSLAPDVQVVWAEAKELQQTRCTVCHAYVAPERLNPSQWRGTLVIMGHRASLTPEEHALLSQYLQANARTPGTY